MKTYTRLLLILLFVLAYGCKVPYQPPVISSPNSYLVVEGVINSSNGSTDSTFIQLSRTNKLTASDAPKPELHAQVSVEDGQGYTFALTDMGKGSYASGPLGLDNTKKYRLHIKTADGKIYLSDLVSTTYTAPIDSIGFAVLNNQVMIYVNTHNPANNTRYYRWDYSETWRYHPPYMSQYATNGREILPRGNSPYPYTTVCYRSDASTDLTIGSSEKLVNDVIYQQPLTYVTGSSQKIEDRYSILVKQYGLSKDAFNFWSQLKKNTEQLGSIFDAQPSQINGNIYCTTNAAEPVFGYISVTNIQTKRVYINRTSLPAVFVTSAFICATDSIFYINPTNPAAPPNVPFTLVPLNSQLIPVDRISRIVGDNTVTPPRLFLDSGYLASGVECLDCSLTGSKTPPPFWKDQ